RSSCRLRKVRSTVVSNSSSSNSVSNYDNTVFATNNFDFSEYNSFTINFDSNFVIRNFQEPKHMENKDQTLKELAIPDVGIPKDYIKMKAFPFSLDGTEKDWLYLQPILCNTWVDMKRMFLEKFFPTSRTATIRKEICGIRQQSGETLHEYWERFRKLCATCPHHQISEQLLIQYFYKGLTMMDQSMIDVVSGGALMDKTPAGVRQLISNMASIHNNLGSEEPAYPGWHPAVRQHQPNMAARVCGIVLLWSTPLRYVPYCKKPNQTILRLSTKSKIPTTTVPITVLAKNATTRQLPISRGPDEVVGYKQLGVSTNYELQQHAILAEFECHDPRPQNQKSRPADAEFEPEADSLLPKPVRSILLPFPNRTLSARKSKIDEDLLKVFRKVEINIPLLDAIKQIPKYAKFLKELCVHKRGKMKGKGGVELSAIVFVLTKNEAATESHQNMLKKCQNPKIFSVPCIIGECTFVDVMLNLRASINVMLISVYKSLNFGALEPIGMTIQLANRSVVQPLGVLV
ncbi:hypothetical protein CR513_15202, partial [Mucuna pruriens]